MMIAIGIVYGLGWRPTAWLGPVLIVLSFAASSLWGSRAFVRSTLLLPVGLGLGLSAGWVELAATRTTILSGDATVRVIGRVALREEDERGRYRYTIDVIRTERPHLTRPPERVRVLVSSRHAPLAIGTLYEGLVRLRPPMGPAFPGAYDFAFMPFFDGTGAFGYSLGAPKSGAEPAPLGFLAWIADLRIAIGDRIRAVLPDERGSVAAALINGERAGIPKDIEDALRVTGLAHVLSISGFHMALVAGMTMLAIRSIVAAFPSLALRWQSKKIAAFLALGVTGFYFLLAGDNAATERSFVMIAIMLGAVLVDRPALTLRNVALAAMVVMLISPHALLSATFQMSFAATAALVGAYGAYSRWTHSENEGRSLFVKLALILAGVLLSSFIAGAATAPYAIYHFQRAAPFGLLANVLATPLFSFWIMPLALAAVCLMPFGLEALALQPMGWGLDAVFWMSKKLAHGLPDYAVGQIGTASLLSFTAALLTISLFQSGLRWLSLAPLVLAFLLVPPLVRPELLISEDARDIAVLADDGAVTDLRKRPNRFLHDQWQRAFQLKTPAKSADKMRFTCMDDICRSTTRSGLRVAWTDKLEHIGTVCDTADIAVVARAPRLEACRTGAKLITLRTLRRTGSLALERQGENAWTLTPSVSQPFEEWNIHRAAPWPEREPFKPNPTREDGSSRQSLSDSDGSNRRGDPEP